MRIDRDSYGTIAHVALAIALAVVLLFLLFGSSVFTWVATLLLLPFFCFVVYFHRVPVRKRTGDDKKISAVADGKIVIIEKTYEKEFLHRECIQVSIYMDFFDVHANFWPMDGVISYYKYHPGKYLLAFLPKASEDNEHSSTAIRNDNGEILFKQIAGTFARRIVCYSKEGERTQAGSQCGIIKFGSRIDMYLPVDSEILVKIGDKVRASESLIAILK